MAQAARPGQVGRERRIGNSRALQRESGVNGLMSISAVKSAILGITDLTTLLAYRDAFRHASDILDFDWIIDLDVATTARWEKLTEIGALITCQIERVHSGSNPERFADHLRYLHIRGELAAMLAEGGKTADKLQCCGKWVNYPAPGQNTHCEICRTTFAIAMNWDN
jgi:hypothetical protein